MKEKSKVRIVNAITGSRIIGALFFPLIISQFGTLGTAIYIGTLWATDAVDGFLAKRKWHVSTIFGAALDAFSDKVLGIASLLYLRMFYPAMIMPIIFEGTIFFANFAYGRKGADVKSSKIGKVKSGVLYISIVLAILSTLSLTNILAAAIPFLITLITVAQTSTLYNYVVTNKKYLKNHKPKKDVSNLGFIETLKEIFRLLKDPKIYSPSYYKEHKNEALLEMLYNEEEKNITLTEKLKEPKNQKSLPRDLTIEDKNEFKILYNLTNDELEKIEKYMFIHNISKEDMKIFLESYINTVKTNYRNANKIESFIQKEIKKTKNK